jgi:CD9 antigen
MLATFFVFLFIIFAVLLTVGIYVVVKRESPEDLKDKIKKAVFEDLKQTVNAINTKQDPHEQKKMNDIQTKYSCCGFEHGITDYTLKDIVHGESCKKPVPNPCTDPVVEDTFKHLTKYSVIIAGVVIGMGIVMLLGMIFSMMLCCAIRDAV